jgi:hypothetical protein
MVSYSPEGGLIYTSAEEEARVLRRAQSLSPGSSVRLLEARPPIVGLAMMVAGSASARSSDRATLWNRREGGGGSGSGGLITALLCGSALGHLRRRPAGFFFLIMAATDRPSHGFA